MAQHNGGKCAMAHCCRAEDEVDCAWEGARAAVCKGMRVLRQNGTAQWWEMCTLL